MTVHQGARAASNRRDDRVGRPRRAFVVDDDVATLDLIGELAREAGWEATGFTHLGALRQALREGAPDLVILDDDLPDGRGGDLARELRSDPSWRGVGVLFCTAAHPARRAELTNWAPVLAKPFDLEDFEAYLGRAADDQGRGSSGRLYPMS